VSLCLPALSVWVCVCVCVCVCVFVCSVCICVYEGRQGGWGSFHGGAKQK